MLNLFRFLYAKFCKRFLQGKAIKNSQIHKTVKIGQGANIVDSKIGKYTACAYGNVIVNTTIGNFCCLADNVSIGLAEHPMDWVSMSAVFQKIKYSGSRKRFARLELPVHRHTVIGNDVWIGQGVVIKAGVTIGDGAVIGSNAVVTKNVPSFAVVGGIPARVIKYRFSQELIDAIIATQWWNMKDYEIQKYAYLINKPDAFTKEILGNKGNYNIK